MFVLHGQTEAAPKPKHPHFVCLDGYAWHPDPIQRPCFQGYCTAAPAALVSKTIDGPPVDRLIGLLELHTLSRSAVAAVFFRGTCPVCAKNHHRLIAERCLWPARKIHPEAVAALREAGVPMRALKDPVLMGDPRPKGKWRSQRRGLPYHKDKSHTLAMQLAFASEMISRRSMQQEEKTWWEGPPEPTRTAYQNRTPREGH